MATIMIVEDNLIYRELLRELCEMDGHEVIEYSRAEEALQVLRNYHETDVHLKVRRIDMFITDFNMDQINGYEFLREVRTFEAMRTVPILMISSTNKVMTDMLHMEGVAFLQKPSSNAEVLAKVRTLLGEKAAVRQDDRPKLPAVVSFPRDVVKERPQRAPEPARPAAPQIPPAAPAARQQPAPVAKAPSLPAAPPPLPPAPVAKAPSLPPAPAARAATPPPLPPVTPPAPQGATAGAVARLDDSLKSSIAQSAPLLEFLTVKKAPVVNAEEASSAASPIADLLVKILENAMRLRASDIHFEPQANALEIRARVDGALQPIVRLPGTVADSIVARIKILCNLNITERRLPQDGQFAWQDSAGRASKFRVSTLPSVLGEKVVIRVLPSEAARPALGALGFSTTEFASVRQVLNSPNGLILVTGPTGSGKTSTLYSMLQSLNSRERNIVTVEDPVEYQLPGITQVQVNAGIGYSFEKVLRAFLRQDPNVILVGEIRDAETAEIALKAAVTGHIVLSTLHTNDAASAVHRLLTMGLPAHLVAAALRMVIAQRLVRVLCPHCKTTAPLSAEEASLLAPAEAASVPRVCHPRGCPSCHGIGYLGRRPVFEVMPILSHETRSAIARHASPDEIKALAQRDGLVAMRAKALQLIAEGVTSLKEAMSLLYV